MCFCSENLQNGDEKFCKIFSGISVDFRNSIFQNFPEKHAWTLLDKLAPSPLAELALTASFPHQSKILSPRPYLHWPHTTNFIPVVPAGVASLNSLTTSGLLDCFALFARQRINRLVSGSGFSKETSSSFKQSFSWSTTSLESHSCDMSVSTALLGSTSNFSSIPAKGNDFLQLHVRLSEFRLGKKAQALCSAILGKDRVVCSGYSSHFEGYQVCSIKITTRGC